ncbi:MAG: hypothetical protein JKY49_00980 [Cohaesibacteraceae bacterium]|nr:hypothetical protein [Cohaesibacteraceae bacterium]MBL4876522.1 hypothetical protein [Cohaesibacteraceae bacterium]
MYLNTGNQYQTALKVGLIVDSRLGSKYIFNLAEWAKQQPDIDFSHLIIQDIPKTEGKFFSKLVQKIRGHGILYIANVVGFKLIDKFERHLLSTTSHKEHYRDFDLSTLVSSTLNIAPIVSKSGYVYRHNDIDIDKIKALNLDVLIRCGSGILRGQILNCAKHGILSFHHGDNTINRGGPAGFWEVYYRQDSTGFIIQKLTEELDGGLVLYRGSIPTKPLYLLNQASIYTKSNIFMCAMLRQLADTGSLPEPQINFPYYNRLYKIPNIREQMIYVFLSMLLGVQFLAQRVLKRKHRWGVAFARSDWTKLVMRRAIKISAKPNHFLADPFVVEENNEHYCFLEDYDFSKKRGSIAAYKLTDNGAEDLGEVLNEDFHLSFPYIFKFHSRIYMIPESSENDDIRVYEATQFPTKWKLASVLMSNISAADSMLFESDDKWWLLTNIDSANSGDHCSELHIFYADNPLSTEWSPHSGNPVIIDSSRARNGGILFAGKEIYRVSQKQGFNMYGKGFSINKLITINTEEYIEQTVCSVKPNFFKHLKGAHHIHSNGTYSVFDYLKISQVGKQL